MRDLHLSLMRLARLQKDVYNPVELQEVLADFPADSHELGGHEDLLKAIALKMHFPPPEPIKNPDPSQVPAIIYRKDLGWGVLLGLNAHEKWVTEFYSEPKGQWVETILPNINEFFIARFKLTKPFNLRGSNVFQLIKAELVSNRNVLFEASLGGVMINLIALATSLYSMQVYDRVVPTAAVQTLLVLTLGVFFATTLEFFAKIARSKLYERLIDATDGRLSRAIFLRFISVRLDQMPTGVGSVAGQLRGYEMIRGFLTSISTQVMVDAPFAIIFIVVIATVAGWLTLIPIFFFVLTLLIGLFYKKKFEYLTAHSTSAANQKTGLLVESIEGAETIKAGHAGWRVLSKWSQVTDEARKHDVGIRQVSEYSQYLVSAVQQLAYVAVVASGALLVSKGELSMGALIATSILSGRILGSVASIPNQLVQWGHAKAGLEGLDKIWNLEHDHHGIDHPIQVDQVHGHYVLEGVESRYTLNPALIVPKLTIHAGEKVGILGTIGSGKTTLLRLLSGMYKPQKGRVLLDQVDIAHISKPMLAQSIGYLQQEGRLFAGTLRENLILGMIDPGDDLILKVAASTGLLDAVILPHPKGLFQEISEGGLGLSGGQKQLVNLTRVFMRKPNIWLLDEPTASMDKNLERHVLSTLKKTLKSSDTLILVTHKPEMLELVNRIVIIANHQVVLDGSKEEVMQKILGLQDHALLNT